MIHVMATRSAAGIFHLRYFEILRFFDRSQRILPVTTRPRTMPYDTARPIHPGGSLITHRRAMILGEVWRLRSVFGPTMGLVDAAVPHRHAATAIAGVRICISQVRAAFRCMSFAITTLLVLCRRALAKFRHFLYSENAGASAVHR